MLSLVSGVWPRKSKSRNNFEIFVEWLLPHSDNSEPLLMSMQSIRERARAVESTTRALGVPNTSVTRAEQVR